MSCVSFIIFNVQMMLMWQKRETKTDIRKSTRVKTEASDDTHGMIQITACAIWESRIFIKHLLGRGFRYAP